MVSRHNNGAELKGRAKLKVWWQCQVKGLPRQKASLRQERNKETYEQGANKTKMSVMRIQPCTDSSKG